MPLRNLIYLTDANAISDFAKKVPENFGWFKPLWVLPRSWCVTASLQAKGVPRHKTSAFIQLQLTRLVPFSDSGVYAIRVGDWIHLWFWENQRVRSFFQARNLEFSTQRLVPETLCQPKFRTGAILHECLEGVEAQLWYEGALLDSAWWPSKTDADEWRTWASAANATVQAGLMPVKWPVSMPSVSSFVGVANQNGKIKTNLLKPWAANILGDKWWHSLRGLHLTLMYSLSGCIFFVLVSYLIAQLWVLHLEQGRVDGEIVTLSAQVEPIVTARSKALDQLLWTNKVALLNQKIGINDFFLELSPVLLQQEVALREFEYGEGELRLMLVPVNGELNVAEIIQKIEALPKLRNIRLLPESDTRTLRLSAKYNKLNSEKSKISGTINSSPSNTDTPKKGIIKQ